MHCIHILLTCYPCIHYLYNSFPVCTNDHKSYFFIQYTLILDCQLMLQMCNRSKICDNDLRFWNILWQTWYKNSGVYQQGLRRLDHPPSQIIQVQKKKKKVDLRERMAGALAMATPAPSATNTRITTHTRKQILCLPDSWHPLLILLPFPSSSSWPRSMSCLSSRCLVPSPIPHL